MMSAKANSTIATYFSSFFSQRMRTRRKRFIQLLVRLMTQRLVRDSGTPRNPPPCGKCAEYIHTAGQGCLWLCSRIPCPSRDFALAPAVARARGIPLASARTLRLTPFFPPIRRVGACTLSAKRRFYHGTVHREPRTVDAGGIIVLIQHRFPGFVEDSGLSPVLKPSVRGAAWYKTAG